MQCEMIYWEGFLMNIRFLGIIHFVVCITVQAMDQNYEAQFSIESLKPLHEEIFLKAAILEQELTAIMESVLIDKEQIAQVEQLLKNEEQIKSACISDHEAPLLKARIKGIPAGLIFKYKLNNRK